MHFVRRFGRAVQACALVAAASACGTTDPAPIAKPPEAIDALPRELTAAERAVIAGSNAFAFGLLREVSAANAGANVFISPVSASMALGMTMNGAAGTTLDEMRTMLGFGSLPLGEVNASYQSLIAMLRGLDPATEFRIANAIWYRDTFPFNESFLVTTRQYFDAEVSPLDFADPAAPDAINAWVDDATNSKIPTIVDEIPPEAVMYLINAMYFKGSWRDRFDPAQTRDDQFTTAAGAPVPVRMMHREGGVSYYVDAELEAVDLPYGNSAFTMTVLLPREGRSVEDLAATLTPERWNAVTAGMSGAEGDVYLPRFTLTFKQLLNDQLKALGMVAAFGPADFTPMSPLGHDLYVSKVLQKTFVDVNEEGTEAAAVTSVEVVVTAAPLRVTFRADRPFLFAIRERFSGTILFVGKLVEPPQS